MGPVSTELAPFFGWGSIEEELLVFADFLADVQREKAPWLTGGESKWTWLDPKRDKAVGMVGDEKRRERRERRTEDEKGKGDTKLKMRR